MKIYWHMHKKWKSAWIMSLSLFVAFQSFVLNMELFYWGNVNSNMLWETCSSGVLDTISLTGIKNLTRDQSMCTHFKFKYQLKTRLIAVSGLSWGGRLPRIELILCQGEGFTF